MNTCAITANGAIIYDYGEERSVWEKPLGKAAAAALIEIAQERFPEIGVELFTREGIVIVQSSEETVSHRKREHVEFIRWREELSERILCAPWYKIICAADHARLLELEAFLKEPPAFLSRFPDCRFVYSEPVFYELLHAEASKGDALGRLAALNRIELSRTFAIGDHYNDVEMLKTAGHGISVENAIPDIKALAETVVCSNNEGAIADAVRYIESIR
jgi:hydroxymethylpyrimidine pyrophosphatase-like HAD family hydrolase